ncbi:MAG: hypothetical protein R3B84_16215 [Zavarzinella sp.]
MLVSLAEVISDRLYDYSFTNRVFTDNPFLIIMQQFHLASFTRAFF